MVNTKWAKRMVILFSFLFLVGYVLELDAYARAGGSRSVGSRGSRTYSAPSPSAPSQSSAAPRYAQPQQPMSQPFQQPGGFMRSLAGGLVGGLLGGMLFRSLGFAGGSGFGGGGIGLMDIVLIGVILYGIYWFIKRRRQQAASATTAYREAGAEAIQPGSYSYAQPESGEDLNRGISFIRQMDPSFEEKKFQDACMDNFFKIQGAWMNRDLGGVRDLMTEEIYEAMKKDTDQMKTEKKINRLENIAVRSVDITEAWQEGGKDYITVKFYANLLDYTTDEGGQVISGSKTDPVKFEEYWTFTRPVGANPWQLSAITQVQ